MRLVEDDDALLEVGEHRAANVAVQEVVVRQEDHVGVAGALAARVVRAHVPLLVRLHRKKKSQINRRLTSEVTRKSQENQHALHH